MGQMVQQLLHNGLTAVPKRFIQPLEKQVSQTPRKDNDGMHLPLVGLSRMEDDQGKKQVMSEISRACTDWGFVQVVNHGVPPALMDAAMDYTKRFFALPSKEKEVYNVRPQPGSNTGYGRVFNEDDERVIEDWNDGFVVPLNKDHANRMEGLPKLTNPHGFQEVVDEYGKAVHKLKRKLLALLSETVGQPSEFFFNKIGGEEAGGHSSFKFYPPCPEPDLVLGFSAHEDSGSTLSFVQQGDVAGLEVLKDGSWVLAQPIPHAFVVNAGGILQGFIKQMAME